MPDYLSFLILFYFVPFTLNAIPKKREMKEQKIFKKDEKVDKKVSEITSARNSVSRKQVLLGLDFIFRIPIMCWPSKPLTKEACYTPTKEKYSFSNALTGTSKALMLC